jgi:hypothetical protein
MGERFTKTQRILSSNPTRTWDPDEPSAEWVPTLQDLVVNEPWLSKREEIDASGETEGEAIEA